MRTAVALLAIYGMITIDQGDAVRHQSDPPSASITADGRFVAFATYVPMAPEDTDASSDVYVLDRVSATVTFESDAIPSETFLDARSPVISGDGRTIVYESAHELVIRDRERAQSRSIGMGRQPSLAHDGTLMAFTSQQDVYLLDLEQGDPQRIAVEAFTPSVSADGRFVAFVSVAAPAKAEDRRPHVFLRDIRAGVTRRMASGWDPSISGDGRFVAYMDHGRRRGETDVLVRDLETGVTQVISRDAKGRPANGPSGNPVLSADGRFVAFQSQASNLADAHAVDDFNLLPDVFVFDRQTGVMRLVSTDERHCWMEESSGPAIAASAPVIAFSSKHPTGAADTGHDFDLYIHAFGST